MNDRSHLKETCQSNYEVHLLNFIEIYFDDVYQHDQHELIKEMLN